MSIPCRGIGVVTRNSMHELVLFLAFPRILDTSAGVRAIKDADSINGGLAVLHVLGSLHSSVSNRRIELAVTRWRAVGKEHNDLLSVFAARSDTLGQFQAIVGARGAGRLNCPNCFLKISHADTGAIDQVRHCLRIVVLILALVVRAIADIFGLIARKLNNSNPVLPIDTLDTLVLLGNGIDKAVGRTFKRIDTLGSVSTAHGITHRTGGIQHHHDVERRGDRHG